MVEPETKRAPRDGGYKMDLKDVAQPILKSNCWPHCRLIGAEGQGTERSVRCAPARSSGEASPLIRVKIYRPATGRFGGGGFKLSDEVSALVVDR